MWTVSTALPIENMRLYRLTDATITQSHFSSSARSHANFTHTFPHCDCSKSVNNSPVLSVWAAECIKYPDLEAKFSDSPQPITQWNNKLFACINAICHHLCKYVYFKIFIVRYSTGNLMNTGSQNIHRTTLQRNPAKKEQASKSVLHTNPDELLNAYTTGCSRHCILDTNLGRAFTYWGLVPYNYWKSWSTLDRGMPCRLLRTVPQGTSFGNIRIQVFPFVIVVFKNRLQVTSIFFRHHNLTNWGRVTHICFSKQTIIGSDNGLSPDRRQTII